MSIFNEISSKINVISKDIYDSFDGVLKEAFECLEKFEKDFQNGKSRMREKTLREKSILTTLQSIDEDEVETKRTPEEKKLKPSIPTEKSNTQSNTQQNETKRASRKRSKEDVDGMSSPDQDKRPKRNASVKAQSVISKQDKPASNTPTDNDVNLPTPKIMVNVNLSQKLRREQSMDTNQSKSKRRDKDDEKENADPVQLIQVKQEKISIPPEPMEEESLPLNIKVKPEISLDKDGMAMPPPAAPVPRPRRAAQKEKREESVDEDGGKRRNTRTRRQKTEEEIDTTVTNAPVASKRSTRASSRASRLTENGETPKDLPKRTRGRKKASESIADTDNDSQGTQDSGIGSIPDKPRPKRTRTRGQKATEKEPEPENIPQKEQIVSEMDFKSPILPIKTKTEANNTVNSTKKIVDYQDKVDSDREIHKNSDTNEVDGKNIEERGLNLTVTINSDLDKTVVLPNGAYDHASTAKNVPNMNETVVIEACNRETIVLDKHKSILMDATVVLERLPLSSNVTDDNSLLTDDDEFIVANNTPPKPPPNTQPSSAVKEKVQKFEELASRVTRNKTRALTTKDEPTDNQTPPDKGSKMILSSDTLTKMNSMIFNGKTTQVSSSASKPRSNIPTTKPTPSSTSKLSALVKAKEAADEQMREKDARRKKEAMLEAKKEAQRKKREEKMAAAAAAREAAEKERQAAMMAAVKEKMEKQAHADQGKLDRLKETERKKQELARKAAETEERRRAEEQARAQRLAEDMRKAEAARKKQMQDAEVIKKEALVMKEIEKKQKEYFEKHKKLKNDATRTTPFKANTPVKVNGYYNIEPVYMCDGFQYLNSESEEEECALPTPDWSTIKGRRSRLMIQDKTSVALVDKLFSVRAQCPDLKEIFPNIERARLKRTSSAVWRTPPRTDARF